MEILKDNESVTEEDIIFESEVTEESEDAEIEEIIEIIEEVEECDDESSDNDKSSSKNKVTDAKTNEITEKSDDANKNIELYSFDEDNSMFVIESTNEETAKSQNISAQKTINKQVITYDVDEDWQDEDLERIELDNNSEIVDSNCENNLQSNKKHVNNQNVLLQSNRLDLRNVVNNIEDDSETPHEIVKNVENNLLYTVLGTKKQDTSAKQQQQDKLSDPQFLKVNTQNTALWHLKSVFFVLLLLSYFIIVLDGTT